MQSIVRRGCDSCRSIIKQITKTVTYCNLQHIRSTCVFEHEYYVPQRRRGQDPDMEAEGYRVYKMIINENTLPRPDIKCILTGVVDGVGFPGQIVDVKRSLFRNELFPSGLAVYPTPENITEVTERLQREGILDKFKNFTPFTRKILKKIVGLNLPIPMNAEQEWELNKTHVRVALRSVKVECTDEDCIELPEEAITEPGEVTLGITINKSKTVKFRATVYLIDQSQQSPPEIQVWDNEPLEFDDTLV